MKTRILAVLLALAVVLALALPALAAVPADTVPYNTGTRHETCTALSTQAQQYYTDGAETLLKLNVMDCFSCKCCEYICSSKIPLVSKINAAKGLVMPLLKKK